MMAVVGFIALFLVMAFITLVVGILWADSLGEYGIGGGENKWYHTLLAFIAIGWVCLGWYKLFELSPFVLEVVG